MSQGERKKKQKETFAEKKRFGALLCSSLGCSDFSCQVPLAGLAAEAQATGSRVMSRVVGYDRAHSGQPRTTIAGRNTYTYAHTAHSSNNDSNSNILASPQDAFESCVKIIEDDMLDGEAAAAKSSHSLPGSVVLADVAVGSADVTVGSVDAITSRQRRWSRMLQ